MILLPLFLLANAAVIDRPVGSPNIIFVSDEAVSDLPLSRDSLDALVNFYALVYGVPRETLDGVIHCESDYNQYARNINPPIEKSYGLVQINLLKHKDISVSQAYSPYFALDYLAKNVAAGRGSMWSCYGNRSG